MKFLFDNNLPPRLASALAALDGGEHVIVSLREKFPANTPDADWLQTLNEEGDWSVISGDRRILRSPHEREAWRRAVVTGFFLANGWHKQSFWDQSWRMVRWWPRIVDMAKSVEPGATYEIPFGPAGGRLKQLRP